MTKRAYPFKCKTCSHSFEVKLRMSEDTSSDQRCPLCGFASMRIYEAPAIDSWNTDGNADRSSND